MFRLADPASRRMIPEIGAQLGDYRIVSRIAKGAYGVVYEAEHVITRRIDALKIMVDAGPWAADEEERFVREIQAQASLQHPNIATVHNAFRTPYGLALVMELVKGESLRVILGRGRVPLAEGVGYILATLAALSCAERAGVVHRDIKPENILIAPEGLVKLTDFGLAWVRNSPRITGSGESIGTPVYMAPEQVTGTEAMDARADIYATGVVLYEVVTGKPPFEGTNAFAVMLAQRDQKPVPPIKLAPEIGPRLNRVILTALEKDPDKRFQSAEAFRVALEEALAATFAAAAAPPPETEHPKPRRTITPKLWLAAAFARLSAAHRVAMRRPWRWVTLAAAFAAGVCGVAAVPAYLALRRNEAPAPVSGPVAPSQVEAPRPAIAAPPVETLSAAPVAAAAPEPPTPHVEQPSRPIPTVRNEAKQAQRAVVRKPQVRAKGQAALAASPPVAVAPAHPRADVPPPEPAASEHARAESPAGNETAGPAPAAEPASEPAADSPAVEQTESAPVPAETARPAPTRKRNPLFRVFGKIFRRH